MATIAQKLGIIDNWAVVLSVILHYLEMPVNR